MWADGQKDRLLSTGDRDGASIRSSLREAVHIRCGSLPRSVFFEVCEIESPVISNGLAHVRIDIDVVGDDA